MQFTVYALPSSLSAGVLLALFIYTLLCRRNAVGAIPFILLAFSGWFWACGNALFLMSISFKAKIFWFNLSQFGPDFSSVFWLMLALVYTEHKQLVHKMRFAWLFVLPLITTVLMWTNDFHHLLRTRINLIPLDGNITTFQITRGPWFWVEITYAYLFFSATLIILFRFWRLNPYKGQTSTLIIALLIPLTANLLDVLGLNPLKFYGSTTVFFTISGMVLAWGLFRQHLFNITPIARDKVLENIGDGVVVIDANHRIVDINPVARQLFNMGAAQPASFVGSNVRDVLNPWATWEERIADLGEVKFQFTVRDGEHLLFFDVIISQLYTGRTVFVGWVAIFHDITEQKEVNQQLQHQIQEIQHLHEQLREQAVRDPLTGCFNRRYLEETLRHEFDRAGQDDYTVGLMMVDIDHFKWVNDTYGHAVGDQVLVSVAQHLQSKVRLGDMVCRFGGEEFLIVLPGISLPVAVERANKFCDQLAALHTLTESGIFVGVTVSIGLALYPKHGINFNEMFNHVDQALYEAKHLGRNCVCVWDSSFMLDSSKLRN